MSTRKKEKSCFMVEKEERIFKEKGKDNSAK